MVIIAISTGYLVLFEDNAQAQIEAPTTATQADDETYSEEDTGLDQSNLEVSSFASNQVSFEFIGRWSREFEISVGGNVGFTYHTREGMRFREEQMFYVPVEIYNPSRRNFTLSYWSMYLPNGEEVRGTGGGFEETLNDVVNSSNSALIGHNRAEGQRRMSGNIYFPYVGDGVYRLVFGGNASDIEHGHTITPVSIYIDVRKEDQSMVLTYDLHQENDTDELVGERRLIQDYLDAYGEGIEIALNNDLFSTVEVKLGDGNEILILLTFTADQEEEFIEVFIPIFKESMDETMSPLIGELREGLDVTYLTFSHRFFDSDGNQLDQLDLTSP